MPYKCFTSQTKSPVNTTELWRESVGEDGDAVNKAAAAKREMNFVVETYTLLRIICLYHNRGSGRDNIWTASPFSDGRAGASWHTHDRRYIWKPKRSKRDSRGVQCWCCRVSLVLSECSKSSQKHNVLCSVLNTVYLTFGVNNNQTQSQKRAAAAAATEEKN